MPDGLLEGILADWRVEPGIVLTLGATGAAYLLGARRARRWPARRVAAFLAGLAVLAFALQSGLHSHGEELLTTHMAQHMLVLLVAPPLLLLGDPLGLALRTLPDGARRALARGLNGRAAAIAAHPAVVLALFAGVLVGSHVPAFYDAALRSEWLHGLEHALYLWVSLLFWAVVLAAAPPPRRASPLVRVLVLLASMPPMALIGVGLMSGDGVAYPAYAEGAERWDVSALADQRTGAALMWIGGSVALIAATLAVAASALRREEARAVAREAYAEARGPARGASP